MFVNDGDKTLIRMGAYIVFLEQLAEKHSQELANANAQIASLQKEKEDLNAEIQRNVPPTTVESAPVASTTVQGGDT